MTEEEKQEIVLDFEDVMAQILDRYHVNATDAASIMELLTPKIEEVLEDFTHDEPLEDE